MNIRALIAIVVTAAALTTSGRALAGTTPLGTAFTYQGQLNLSGNPVSATADFQFTLFDALAGPNQVGSMVPVNNVTISSGLFTVAIDFGASAFDGNERYMQIAVRSPAGSGPFIPLSPRQPLNSAPYALHTRGLFVDNNLNVGIGTTAPLNQLHVRGVQATLRLEATDDPLSFTEVKDAQATQLRINKVNNNGLVLLDLNPKPTDGVSNASVRLFRETNTTGLRSLQLHRGNNTSQLSALIGVDGGDSFFQAHGGKVGVGTTSPTSKLHVVHNNLDDEAAILGTNFATGVHGIGAPGVLGESVFGSGVGGSSSNYVGVFGSSDNFDSFDFFAGGAGGDYGALSSIRWKDNVTAIDDPLGMLGQIRGVYFDWDTEHGGHHDVGMIAEEVGQVLPEIVSYEKNGIDAIGMDYSKLTPLLVEAVKMLRAEKDAEIAGQSNRIAELESQNTELRLRLREIELVIEQLHAPNRCHPINEATTQTQGDKT